MRVSVVLITKNQEWNLRRLIESVLDELESEAMQQDVVLVDSASVDNGPSIAATYPIRVFVLVDTEPLTAAAGRHIGYESTKGDYVLFLDGDMELVPGWLRHAVGVLDRNPEIAVVGGSRIDLLPEESSTSHLNEAIKLLSQSEIPFRDVRHGGGASLYRRAALEEVGSFNPFLISDEEPELCLRIRYRGGMRVVALDAPHVIHYTLPLEEFSTLYGRARKRLWYGSGQCIRYLWGSPIIWPYLRERGFGLPPGIAVVLGIAALGVFLGTGRPALLLLWIGALLAIIAIQSLRKRSLHKALLSLFERTLIFLGTIRGLWLPTPPPDSYKATVDVVR